MGQPRRFGPWIVERRIGEGAFGTVWACTHRSDPATRAAVKVLSPEMAAKASIRRRFEAEHRNLQLLRAVPHPHINRVLDTHALDDDDDTAWIALELIEGCSVDEALTQGRRPDGSPMPTRPEDRAALARELGIAIASAAAHAASLGVVHRDIKPDNIRWEPGGRMVLVDFGIAQDARATRLTRADQRSPFTPDYAAPELVEGRPVDATWASRLDTYAIGCTMYEVFTGVPPHAPRQHTTDGTQVWLPRTEPLTLPPDAPPWLAGLIARMTDPRATRRPDPAMVAAELLELDASGPAPDGRRRTQLDGASPRGPDPHRTASAPTYDRGPPEAEAPAPSVAPRSVSERDDPARSRGGGPLRWALLALVGLMGLGCAGLVGLWGLGGVGGGGAATPSPASAPPPGATAAVCGDGTVQPGEGCDDGNTRSGDGCSSLCTSEAPAAAPVASGPVAARPSPAKARAPAAAPSARPPTRGDAPTTAPPSPTPRTPTPSVVSPAPTPAPEPQPEPEPEPEPEAFPPDSAAALQRYVARADRAAFQTLVDHVADDPSWLAGFDTPTIRKVVEKGMRGYDRSIYPPRGASAAVSQVLPTLGDDLSCGEVKVWLSWTYGQRRSFEGTGDFYDRWCRTCLDRHPTLDLDALACRKRQSDGYRYKNGRCVHKDNEIFQAGCP